LSGRGRPASPITLTLPGRPRSTKNSRKIVRVRGQLRSVMSDTAAACVKEARVSLRKQWKGRPLQVPAGVQVHVVFANRRSLPDPDNVLNFTLDVLKGIALQDDSLACIPTLALTHEITSGAQECVRVTLTPQEPQP
jgi:Holliday junction resolvase RusA-like endonuclease